MNDFLTTEWASSIVTQLNTEIHLPQLERVQPDYPQSMDLIRVPQIEVPWDQTCPSQSSLIPVSPLCTQIRPSSNPPVVLG